MKRNIKINSLKDITKLVLMFVVISVHGDFVSDGISTIVTPEFTPLIMEMAHTIKDGRLEPVSFTARYSEDSDKTITRKGELFIRDNAKATILICHGYMCDKNDISFIRTVFSNYNVMTFDFRAHGENIDETQHCTFGKEEAFDVLGAAEYLKNRTELAGKPLIAYGFSMGAVSAIEAQARRSLFDGMILDCPFDSTDNLIKKIINQMTINILGYEIPFPGRRILQKYAYNNYVQSFVKGMLKTIAKFDALQTKTRVLPVAPVESIEKVSVPCYFIICKNDEKVSVEAVTSVFAGAKGYKRLWITNGRRHFDSFFNSPEAYTHVVNTFVDQVVAENLLTIHQL